MDIRQQGIDIQGLDGADSSFQRTFVAQAADRSFLIRVFRFLDARFLDSARYLQFQLPTHRSSGS